MRPLMSARVSAQISLARSAVSMANSMATTTACFFVVTDSPVKPSRHVIYKLGQSWMTASGRLRPVGPASHVANSKDLTRCDELPLSTQSRHLRLLISLFAKQPSSIDITRSEIVS